VVLEIRLSDIVWIPPGAKHWHGATPSNGMRHIASSEALDGGRSHGWSRYRKSSTGADAMALR
jgi:quercetin dioxygenase-like cupin family protein